MVSKKDVDGHWVNRGYKYAITGNRGRFRTATGYTKTLKKAKAIVESYKKARRSMYKVDNPRIRKLRK